MLGYSICRSLYTYKGNIVSWEPLTARTLHVLMEYVGVDLCKAPTYRALHSRIFDKLCFCRRRRGVPLRSSFHGWRPGAPLRCKWQRRVLPSERAASWIPACRRDGRHYLLGLRVWYVVVIPDHCRAHIHLGHDSDDHCFSSL